MLADRGIRLIGGLAVGLWLARYLGPGDFGILSTATAVTYMGVVIAQFGLDGLVQREFVQRPTETGTILGTVTVMSLIGAVVGWGTIAIITALSVDNPTLRNVALWVALLVLPQILIAWEYLFQARTDMRPVVIAQNITFCVCVAIRAVMIIWKMPVLAFAILIVVERLTGSIAVLVWASRRHRYGELRFDRRLARAMLVESWPVWLGAILTTLYLKLDMVLIVRWKDVVAAGTYAAALKFSELWWMISMLVATAMLPEVVRARSRGEKEYWTLMQRYLDGSLIIALTAAITMTFIAHPLVAFFYGHRFADSANILRIHFWSGIFIYLSVSRSRHIIASGRRLVELWLNLGGMGLNLMANFILIPRYGALGAAWAGLATQLSIALIFPWFFADTQQVVRAEIAAFGFPVRLPGYWRAIRRRLWPNKVIDAGKS